MVVFAIRLVVLQFQKCLEAEHELKKGVVLLGPEVSKIPLSQYISNALCSFLTFYLVLFYINSQSHDFLLLLYYFALKYIWEQRNHNGPSSKGLVSKARVKVCNSYMGNSWGK